MVTVERDKLIKVIERELKDIIIGCIFMEVEVDDEPAIMVEYIKKEYIVDRIKCLCNVEHMVIISKKWSMDIHRYSNGEYFVGKYK